MRYVEMYELSGVEADQVAGGAVECGSRFVDAVEDAYLATAEPRMSATLQTATRFCLSENGLRTSGDEQQLADFMTEGKSANVRHTAVDRCVLKEVRRLYPQFENPSLDPDS